MYCAHLYTESVIVHQIVYPCTFVYSVQEISVHPVGRLVHPVQFRISE
jgi:hypothetical protein